MTGRTYIPPHIRHGFTAMLFTLMVAAPPTAAANDNAQNRQTIDTLKVVHLIALPAGIITPPPFDKPFELVEYGTNIGLKFVPAVLEPPPPIVVRPNNGACEFRYLASEHPLYPSFDYENIFGFTLELPDDWGRLDDGDLFMSNRFAPDIYHYNTGAYVTIRRQLFDTVADPQPWYPQQTRLRLTGEEILFSNTNNRDNIINGNFSADNMEIFPLGTTALNWEVETKIDIVFDVMLGPLIFFAEAKYSARAAAKFAKQKRFARVWDDAAIKWAKSLDTTLGGEIFRSAAKTLVALGLEVSANELENATGQALGGFPTGSINSMSQALIVLDEVAPSVELTQQPGPFEANTLGGEFGNRHFNELRDLLVVSDECDRPVQIDAEPRGTRFWPVGQTTTLQWCGRDPGPTSASGGRNESCVDIQVDVVDTRPPLLLPPPSVNMISASPSSTLNIGWAGVFDVADPEVVVTNNAPATFPVGRTPVTWTAMDSSGNSTTSTQWVNLKPNNTSPVALSGPVVNTMSFEQTRIDLDAEDLDQLDGRHDQLAFRIEDPPDNGFFVAPLFPFFIDDHRQHRINPDGTYSSFITEAIDACELTGADSDITTILEPFFVTVNDDDVMYVMDRYLTCSGPQGSRFLNTNYRIAKFTPNAAGELEYETHYDIGQNQPGDLGRHLFIDHKDQLWIVPPNQERIVALSPDLEPVLEIRYNELTQINPSTGNVDDAFQSPNSDVQSVAVDRNDILYATDGSQMFAYDLQRREAADPTTYFRLYSVAYRPGSGVDTSVEEPWVSYESFLTGGYADLVLDSDDNIYVSDPVVNRLWKFQATRLSKDRTTIKQAPELIGWLGKCTANLDPTVLACDTVLERSIGYSCQDDLCGSATTAGSDQGQFSLPTGIAMSPQDVLYVTDTGNFRIQRFTTDGFFAGEAVSECNGSCFILGDFGFVTNVAVNSNFFYLLDTDNDLTHIFQTTPITDIDDQTMSPTQTAFVTYQSNDNYRGPDSFSFSAHDGLDSSNDALVNIAVSRNFRAPIATPGLQFDGFEDQGIPLQLSGLDRDEDQLEFLIDTQPQNGVITINGDQFTYTPNADFFGVDTFTYVASDAPGSVPPLVSEAEPVTVNVASVNDAPLLSAEPLDDAGAGFEMQLEALLTDVDLDDSHRVAIDWGNGVVISSNADDITNGSSSGKVRVIAQNVYDDFGNYIVTVCASDVPSNAALTCSSADVNSTLQLPITVVAMVDLRLDIVDSMAKTPDADIPEIEVSDPLLDGAGAVTYTLKVMNRRSSSDFQPTASNAQVTIKLPSEMDLLNVTPNMGSCNVTNLTAICSFGDMASGAEALVEITAMGGGRLIADEIVTLQAVASADERSTSNASAGSLQTTLLLNGDLDADNDGVINRDDAFPGDPTESVDTDSDGIGNNADLDDDGDTIPDRWERRFGLDSLDASDRFGDFDNDGLTNELEFAANTRPDVADSDMDSFIDSIDNCPHHFNRNQYDTNGDMLGDVCDPRSLAAVAGVGDADGDSVTDFALARTVNGDTTAYVKSGDSDLDIAVISVVSATDQAEKLLEIAQLSGSGRRGLAMVYTDDKGAVQVAVHDAWSGNQLADFNVFANTVRFVDGGVSSNDVDGDTLLILARNNDGSAMVRLRNPADGSVSGEIPFFDAAAGHEVLAVGGAGSQAVIVLAEDDSGNLMVEARDITAGTLTGSWDVSTADWLSVRLLGLSDGFAVITTDTAGNSEVSIWALQSATETVRFDVFDASWTPVDVGDATVSGTGLVIAVAAIDDSSNVEVRTFESDTGQQISQFAFLSDTDTLRGMRVGNRIGVLAANSNGDITLEQRDTTTGDSAPTLTAESVQPPPPPPPPPPPSAGGSGGGGGALGFWMLLLGCGRLLARKSGGRLVEPPIRGFSVPL